MRNRISFVIWTGGPQRLKFREVVRAYQERTAQKYARQKYGKGAWVERGDYWLYAPASASKHIEKEIAKANKVLKQDESRFTRV